MAFSTDEFAFATNNNNCQQSSEARNVNVTLMDIY